MELSSITFKRLMKDVRDILKNPLEENGIYYIHDEENILKGYSLIIGPEDTPYAYGNYLFEIDFPKDYPINPPKITFLTNSDNIRMNPNLYRNGKVCISILNTWRGEQWSSCQTIKTILLTLLTLLNNEPLLNEPGFNKHSEDFTPYNKIIEFKNIDISIIKLINEKIINVNIFNKFKDIIMENFKKNKKCILAFIKANLMNNCLVNTRVYNMRVNINYVELEKNIKKIKIK